jgi:hypothetical protein
MRSGLVMKFRLQRLRLFHSDHAVLPDAFHRCGDKLADIAIVVRRHGRDVRQFFLALYFLRHALQLGDDLFGRELNTALQ